MAHRLYPGEGQEAQDGGVATKVARDGELSSDSSRLQCSTSVPIPSIPVYPGPGADQIWSCEQASASVLPFCCCLRSQRWSDVPNRHSLISTTISPSPSPSRFFSFPIPIIQPIARLYQPVSICPSPQLLLHRPRRFGIFKSYRINQVPKVYRGQLLSESGTLLSTQQATSYFVP